MAKKRKTTSRRRRRIGAAGLNLSSPVAKLAAVAGAYFLAADPVNNMLTPFVAKVLPSKDAAGLPVAGVPSETGKTVLLAGEAIGAYMLLMKGRSSMVKTLAGAILAGAALKSGLKKFGVISGYQGVPALAGYQGVPALAGYADRPASLNGYGVNGYRVNGRSQSMMSGAMSGSDLME